VLLVVVVVVVVLDDEVGSSEIDATFPVTAVVAPLAVTAARWPTFTLGNDVSGTATVISVDPLPTMTIESALLVDSPLTRSVEAIVPAIGAVIAAALRLAAALVTAACELVTVILSCATLDALDVADPPAVEPPAV
jgi:hypothetical protein